MLAWIESGVLTVGSVDPGDGEFSAAVEFDLGDFAVAGNAPTASDELYFRRLVSPDYSRAYAQRIVDGDAHMGWVDQDGLFTDITLAVTGPRTDFGGDPAVGGHGFDLLGNFYYSTMDQREITVWRLPQGQTSGATPVYSAQDYLINPRIMVDGTLDFQNIGCVPRGSVGIIDGGYVWTDGTQVYRRTGVPPAGAPAQNCPADDVALLPDTNSSPVATPVANDDGSLVAFAFTDRDDTRSIYSVNSADGSNATETVVAEWPADDAALVDWID